MAERGFTYTCDRCGERVFVPCDDQFAAPYLHKPSGWETHVVPLDGFDGGHCVQLCAECMEEYRGVVREWW